MAPKPRSKTRQTSFPDLTLDQFTKVVESNEKLRARLAEMPRFGVGRPIPAPELFLMPPPVVAKNQSGWQPWGTEFYGKLHRGIWVEFDPYLRFMPLQHSIYKARESSAVIARAGQFTGMAQFGRVMAYRFNIRVADSAMPTLCLLARPDDRIKVRAINQIDALLMDWRGQWADQFASEALEVRHGSIVGESDGDYPTVIPAIDVQDIQTEALAEVV